MAQNTRVVRNAITIDGRTYEAKVLGGGKFNVLNSARERVGSFTVKGRAVEAEDLGVQGADPIALIGQLWVRENLSSHGPLPPADAKPAEAKPPEPRPSEPIASAPTPPPAPKPQPPPTEGKTGATGATCRMVTHDRPDRASLEKAIAYVEWLRQQDGVQAAYLTHDSETGKTVSITIWESRDKMTALRYAKPPEGAMPLKAVSIELSWVVGRV